MAFILKIGDVNYPGTSGQIGRNEPLKQYIEDTKNKPDTKSTEKSAPAAKNEQNPPTQVMTQADIHAKKFQLKMEAEFSVSNEVKENLLQLVSELAKDPKNKIPKQTTETIIAANQVSTYAKTKGLNEDNKHRVNKEIDKIAKRTELRFPASARVAKSLIEYLNSDMAI